MKNTKQQNQQQMNKDTSKITKEELFKELRKRVADVVKEFFEKVLIAEREEQKRLYNDQGNGFYTRRVLIQNLVPLITLNSKA